MVSRAAMTRSPGRSRASRVVLRAAGVALTAGILIVAFTPVVDLAARHVPVTPARRPAVAVVVLGSGVTPDGVLSESSLRRLVDGVVLVRRGLAPLLVIAGSEQETAVRHALALDLGVPAPAVHVLPPVRTTREEARAVAALPAVRHSPRVIVVTDTVHRARAAALFHAEGLDVQVAAVNVGMVADSPEGRLRLTQRLAEEVLATLYARLVSPAAR